MTRGQEVLTAQAAELEGVGKKRDREKALHIITACIVSTMQCASALGVQPHEISQEILKWAAQKHAENAPEENKSVEHQE